MHVIFDPDAINWSALIDNADEKIQIGGSYNVFHGVPYQRGSGIGAIFRSFYRALLPLGRQAGIALGQQGLQSTQKILSDMMEGKPFKDAVVDETRVGVKSLIDKISDKAADQGSTQLKNFIDKVSKHKRSMNGGRMTSYKKNRLEPTPMMRKRFGFQNTKQPKTYKPSKKKRVDALGYY